MRIVEAAGGRIDGRTEYAPTETDQGSATLQLRIPADKLTATLDKLEELGRADEVSLSTSDVTVESQDLDARITALRASIERLNGLMAQATDIDDLITLESAISSRQGELESLEAQQRYLADQVSMSTHLALPALRRRGAEDRARRLLVGSRDRLERVRRVLGGTARGARGAAAVADHAGADRGDHHLDRAPAPPGRHGIRRPAAAERIALGDRRAAQASERKRASRAKP